MGAINHTPVRVVAMPRHRHLPRHAVQASMYVRIKRKRTTVFLHVEPTDTVLSIKTKVQDLLQEPPARQRLYKDGAQLDDGRSLADLKVETDDVLALALRHEGELARSAGSA